MTFKSHPAPPGLAGKCSAALLSQGSDSWKLVLAVSSGHPRPDGAEKFLRGQQWDPKGPGLCRPHSQHPKLHDTEMSAPLCWCPCSVLVVHEISTRWQAALLQGRDKDDKVLAYEAVCCDMITGYDNCDNGTLEGQRASTLTVLHRGHLPALTLTLLLINSAFQLTAQAGK